MIRHGDVIIMKVKAIPEDAQSLGQRKELAYGEVTGHAHRVDIGELFETKNGQLFLKVEKLANLSHEEHKSVTLPKGNYQVFIKRQATSDSKWGRVHD